MAPLKTVEDRSGAFHHQEFLLNPSMGFCPGLGTWAEPVIHMLEGGGWRWVRLTLREPRIRVARYDVPGHSQWGKRSRNSEEAEVSDGFPQAVPEFPEDLVPMGARLIWSLHIGGRVCLDRPWGGNSSSSLTT